MNSKLINQTSDLKPENTLFLLITCSLDDSRNDVAKRVTKNISELISFINQPQRLIVFDNASKYLDHLPFIDKNSFICKSSKNLGLWSAIDWVLNNYQDLTKEKFKYLYIIESDCYHFNFSNLKNCENFLRLNKDISCIRTQEFKLNQKWRFNKKLHYLPFYKERSAVNLRNAVTNEKAFFLRERKFQKIYKSNLHPKLPSFHRISALKKVFRSLSKMRNFTEQDYFRVSMSFNKYIGILDNGMYYYLSSANSKEIVSGSWSNSDHLAKIGYLRTRKSEILKYSSNDIKIS